MPKQKKNCFARKMFYGREKKGKQIPASTPAILVSRLSLWSLAAAHQFAAGIHRQLQKS